MFRRGLEGDAKEWYCNLPTEKRQDWAELKSAFIKRFPLRVYRADPGIAHRIDTLERRPSELFAAYINRATELSHRATDEQLKKLRDRFIKYLCAGGHEDDEVLQTRVTDRMYARDLLDDMNDISDKCSFATVRDLIIACSTKPGRDNPILEELTGMSRRRPRRADDAVVELTSMVKQLVVQNALSAHSYVNSILMQFLMSDRGSFSQPMLAKASHEA